MSRSARHHSRRMSRQFSELSAAVPQVIAHRMALMASAGLNPASTPWKETWLMSAEKISAFNESWMAMWAQAVRSQQEMALASMRSWGAAGWGLQTVGQSMNQSVNALQAAALGVVSQGLTPVHRRAVANAKRLARPRR